MADVQQLPNKVECEYCGGSGERESDYHGPYPCPECEGTGYYIPSEHQSPTTEFWDEEGRIFSTYRKMTSYLTKLGADLSHLRSSTSRLTRGEPVTYLGSLTDEEFVQYRHVLVATVKHPHWLMNRTAMLVEKCAVEVEAVKRRLSSEPIYEFICHACDWEVQGTREDLEALKAEHANDCDNSDDPEMTIGAPTPIAASKTATSAWEYMDSEERIDHLVKEHARSKAGIYKRVGEPDAGQDYADALNPLHEHDEGYPKRGVPHTHTASKTAHAVCPKCGSSNVTAPYYPPGATYGSEAFEDYGKCEDCGNTFSAWFDSGEHSHDTKQAAWEGREEPPMMECGHAANARTSDGRPACVICVGLHPGAETIAANPPNLEGRQSQCVYCKKTSPSSAKLPFFEHQPDKEMDSHYDGCRGWD